MYSKIKTIQRKGFTLVELLIVIAILAILATATVLILNPAELLKQGRDSTRISDLAALNSALALYLADVASPDLGTCSSTVARVTAATTTSPFATRSGTSTAITSISVTGTAGWVDVNFASISSGAPLSKLPLDPVNNATIFYAYACEETGYTYELNANMESTKYANGGGSDKEANDKDGGDNALWYEVGSRSNLNL